MCISSLPTLGYVSDPLFLEAHMPHENRYRVSSLFDKVLHDFGKWQRKSKLLLLPCWTGRTKINKVLRPLHCIYTEIKMAKMFGKETDRGGPGSLGRVKFRRVKI